MTDTDWPTGLMVIQGNHLEALRDVMTQWIRTYPLGPLEDEQILVQSNGIAQWLKMALAEDTDKGGCGIAAAMNVQLPGRFLWQGYRGFQPDIPKISPFDKGPLTWTLYRLLADIPALKAAVPEPEVLKPLLGFLQEGASSAQDADGDSPSGDPRRLHQLAGNLADLYDQYQVYRPDWLSAWERGEDIILRPGRTPEQQPIDPEQRWQPALWRLATQTIQQSDSETDADSWAKKSRADIHTSIVALCRQMHEAPEDLPRRVIVFGISALPHSVLEFLQAMAKFSQVMLFVHNPCQHYWGDLIEDRQLLKQYSRTQSRKLDASLNPEDLHLQGNPLLASWGKQGRDYLHLLDEQDQPEAYKDHFNKIDLFASPHLLTEGEGHEASGPTPLLKQLQDDIFELRSLDERKILSQQPASQVDPIQDHSLQFLIAHSAQREVEILHDQLLNAFQQAKSEGQTLNPRDILVMVPDINVYAAHIQAVFGRYKPDEEGKPDPRYIPFHLSDQGQRGRNSLLAAFETLLHSRDARFSVSELLDLLATPALLKRFGLDVNDLPKLHQWIQGANVRWGLDAEHRREIGLPEAGEQNSWLFGLKRMLLGYATGSSLSWQPNSGPVIEPYDEVAGLEAALLGPLVLLIDAITDLRQQLKQPRSATDWETLLNQTCDRFFMGEGKGDRWALDNIKTVLEQWRDVFEHGYCSDLLLPPEVARDEIMARIDKPSLTQKFLGGSVNFATLMPMRAIPFKQIWMLGMNDNDYPRSQKSSDFDLMAGDYRPGDRSRREDDRYLFLEALLSARDKLVISWVGRNIRDNSAKPPSVLVGQLRDYLQQGWPQAEGNLLEQITTEHPLQPFSKGYFSPNAEVQGLYTYAAEWRQVHKRVTPQALPMPALSLEAPITLKQLADFLRHPLKSFYQFRLGVSWYDQGETAEDDELFATDGLSKWALHRQLFNALNLSLSQQTSGSVEQHLDQAFARLKHSGGLPMQHFAELMQQELKAELLPAAEHYQSLLQEYPHTVAGRVHQLSVIGCGVKTELEAQILDSRKRHPADTEAARIILQPSNLFKGGETKHYHLVKYWPEHLLAQLDQPTTTYLLGSQSETPVIFKPMTADMATERLQELSEHWLQGMSTPQPLACKTALKWLFDADKAADPYEGGYKQSAERDEHPGYQRLWPDFDNLIDDGRFAERAKALYQPMLDNLKHDDSRQASDGQQNHTLENTYSNEGSLKSVSLLGAQSS